MKSKRTVGGLVAALVIALLTWWVYGDDGASQEPPSSGPSGSISAATSGSTETEITAPFGPSETTAPVTEPETSIADTTGLGQASTTTTLPTESTTAYESGVDPDSGLEWVAAPDLPAEAHDTLALVDSDGPYPYDQDGSTFENREGILPDHPVGYYREFTVDTPGENHRGARRIVVGDGGEFYYTRDHYESFQRISR